MATAITPASTTNKWTHLYRQVSSAWKPLYWWRYTPPSPKTTFTI